MHEVHKVRGRFEDDFEAAFRQGWMPMLAAGDDARAGAVVGPGFRRSALPIPPPEQAQAAPPGAIGVGAYARSITYGVGGCDYASYE